MEISIIGSGYVGLVTGACFAEMGHQVICLDIDKKKIDRLNKGIIPIYEPGLEELIKKNKKEKRIFFTTDYKKAIENSTACFICVPTPSDDNGGCNIDYVLSAAKEISEHINSYKTIITKSTVIAGTTFQVKKIINENLIKRGVNIDFDVVSNPEFLKEGTAIQDCLKPDRIIIGSESEKATQVMKEIYSGFTINHDKFIVMDILSSEMTKYAANAMLATRISFMNELAKLCKKIGANINEIRKGIGSDARIGYSFLYAGIGYGGSCFPKDLRALCALAKKHNEKMHLLEAVDSINNNQKKLLAHNIINFFEPKGGVKGKTIAIWGLSFKPDTDDIREAPSLTLIEMLLKKGAQLRIFDPVAMGNVKKLFKNNKNIIYCKNETHAAQSSDAIALLTEWKQFRLLNFSPIKKKMKGAVIFDGRNQYNPLDMQKKGFEYIGVGIPKK